MTRRVSTGGCYNHSATELDMKLGSSLELCRLYKIWSHSSGSQGPLNEFEQVLMITKLSPKVHGGSQTGGMLNFCELLEICNFRQAQAENSAENQLLHWFWKVFQHLHNEFQVWKHIFISCIYENRQIWLWFWHLFCTYFLRFITQCIGADCRCIVQFLKWFFHNINHSGHILLQWDQFFFGHLSSYKTFSHLIIHFDASSCARIEFSFQSFGLIRSSKPYEPSTPKSGIASTYIYSISTTTNLLYMMVYYVIYIIELSAKDFLVPA